MYVRVYLREDPKIGFKCIGKDEDSKDEVCKKAKDLSKTSRRRRLLHNGGKAS